MTSVSANLRNHRGRPMPNCKEKKIIRQFILQINSKCETANNDKRMLNKSPRRKCTTISKKKINSSKAEVNYSGEKEVLRTLDKTVECSGIEEPKKTAVSVTGTIEKAVQPFGKEVDLRAESPTKTVSATEDIQDVNIDIVLDPNVTNDALDSNATNNAFQNAHIRDIDVLLSCNDDGNQSYDLTKELHPTNVLFDGSLCDDSGNCSIHIAVITGDHLQVYQQWIVLRSRGLSLDLKNGNAQTPLHIAVQYGDSSMTLLLLKLGADPTIKDREGNTALHICIPAIKNDKSLFKCFELIMETDHVPNMINSFNNRGFSPLHQAAFYGALEEAIWIIKAGAQIDLKDRLSGRTPLFLSIEEGRKDIMKLLLKNGADCLIKNMAGQTPHLAAVKILAVHLNGRNKKILKRKISETS